MRRAIDPRTQAARDARSRAYRRAVAMHAPAATPEAEPEDREEFRTYGTARVYRHIPGVYHEPLAYVAKTPAAAKRKAELFNLMLQ